MSRDDRIMLIAAILAVPWTVLAGWIWWDGSRPGGSSPFLRYGIYSLPIVLSLVAIAGAVR